MAHPSLACAALLLTATALTANAAMINIGGVFGGWIVVGPPKHYPNYAAAVGDTLNFTYPADPAVYHNVWQMPDAATWGSCTFDKATLLSNNTPVFYLKVTKPGTFYYACNAQGFHCIAGQKTIVTVTKGGGGGSTSSPPKAVAPKAVAPKAVAPKAVAPKAAPPKPAPPCSTAAPPPSGSTASKTLNIGGEAGWIVTNLVYPNYTATVGDTLNFTYPPTAGTFHNVWSLPDATAWLNCDFTKAKLLSNATAVFMLKASKPGVYYYACNAQGFHCIAKQKTVVTVKAAAGVNSGSAAFPLCSPPPPSEISGSSGSLGSGNGTMIDIGGDDGWYPRIYPPLTAYVGDTLNFTGHNAFGAFAIEDFGTSRPEFTACIFRGHAVKNLGFKATVVLDKVGSRYFSSPASAGVYCRLGLMKLNVTVLAASARPKSPPPPKQPPPMPLASPSPVSSAPPPAVPSPPALTDAPPSLPATAPAHVLAPVSGQAGGHIPDEENGAKAPAPGSGKGASHSRQPHGGFSFAVVVLTGLTASATVLCHTF